MRPRSVTRCNRILVRKNFPSPRDPLTACPIRHPLQFVVAQQQSYVYASHGLPDPSPPASKKRGALADRGRPASPPRQGLFLWIFDNGDFVGWVFVPRSPRSAMVLLFSVPSGLDAFAFRLDRRLGRVPLAVCLLPSVLASHARIIRIFWFRPGRSAARTAPGAKPLSRAI